MLDKFCVMEKTHRGTGRKSDPLLCEAYWEAFDICRERDRPIWVKVESGDKCILAKIFPSGRIENETEVL